MRSAIQRIRLAVYYQLEPKAWGYGLSPTNWIICALITLSFIGAVLETEPLIASGREHLIRTLELVFSTVFALEYLCRLWCSVESSRYRHPLWGRLNYLITPAALLDLVAILPLLLGLVGAQTLLLRFIRLLRIFRLAKFGKFSRAMHHVAVAIRSRLYELTISMVLAVGMILLASILMYLVEGEVQPDTFGSIPRAIWWSVITFTTVGYGDVYPITQLGKVLAGLTALASIAMVAMPAGILAAAFGDAMRKGRDEEDRHIRIKRNKNSRIG